jgi:hypothetical protein
LDIGYLRATEGNRRFALVYVTPDVEKPAIVNRIRNEEQSFPANRNADPRLVSQCLYWSSWSLIGDILSRSYEEKLFGDIEQLFTLDLLAYLAKKRLWQNQLSDDPSFYLDKLYRPLRKSDSPFIPYFEKATERDESWRRGVWDAESLRALLQALRWEDKFLLQVLAKAGGAMRQDRLIREIPFLKGRNSASLRSLKSHINAQCKGRGKGPILAVGTGSGDNRVHEINSELGDLRQVVIDEAKAFVIPEGVMK